MEAKTGKKVDTLVHPDGGYGWVIVFAIILINVTLMTLVQCFGLIFRDEFEEWGITAAQTSFLLHLQSSLYCALGFFSSPFLKKYGMRPVAFFGASLMCLGILLSSFATSYMFLIFSVSILIGLGQGILMPATYLATYTYFKERLTIAVSLSVTGASMSPIVMPKVCDILLSRIGRTHTILMLFCLSLLSLVGCYLLKPIKQKKEDPDQERRLEEVSGTFNGGNQKEEASEQLLLDHNSPSTTQCQPTTATSDKKDTFQSKIFQIFDLHLLKDIPFVLIVIGLGLSFAAELNIILMLQFILQELSLFDRSSVASAVSVLSIADIFGRLVVPFLGHYFKAPSKFMYAGALVVASLGRTVLAIWCKSKIMVFIAVVTIGATKGSRAVFQSVIIPKYVPLEKIPTANGINMLFTGSISLIVGPLIGAVHDQTKSYVYALYMASALSIACVILWIFESTFWKKKTVNIEGNNK